VRVSISSGVKAVRTYGGKTIEAFRRGDGNWFKTVPSRHWELLLSSTDPRETTNLAAQRKPVSTLCPPRCEGKSSAAAPCLAPPR